MKRVLDTIKILKDASEKALSRIPRQIATGIKEPLPAKLAGASLAILATIALIKHLAHGTHIGELTSLSQLIPIAGLFIGTAILIEILQLAFVLTISHYIGTRKWLKNSTPKKITIIKLLIVGNSYLLSINLLFYFWMSTNAPNELNNILNFPNEESLLAKASAGLAELHIILLLCIPFYANAIGEDMGHPKDARLNLGELNPPEIVEIKTMQRYQDSLTAPTESKTFLITCMVLGYAIIQIITSYLQTNLDHLIFVIGITIGMLSTLRHDIFREINKRYHKHLLLTTFILIFLNGFTT